MPTKKPIKPKKQTKEYWDWRSVQKYVEAKYKICMEDYGGKFKNSKVNEEAPYLDFWHWILDRCDIHNGCYTTFYIKEWLDEKADGDELDEYVAPDWVKEILQLIYDEFGEMEMEVYIWW
jgi:hypothetical protein